MLFKSRKRKIHDELAEYRSTVSVCVRRACEALIEYQKTSDRAQLEAEIKEVSQLEGSADNMRRSLEVLLYSKSLFPESRGDLLGLLETTDRIANRAQAMVIMLKTHFLEIPEAFHVEMEELATCSMRCVDALLDAQAQLFTDFKGTIELIGRVNELESNADHLEHSLLEKIFGSSEVKGYQKLILKDLVDYVSSLSDQAENVADRLRIIVAKRGI